MIAKGSEWRTRLTGRAALLSLSGLGALVVIAGIAARTHSSGRDTTETILLTEAAARQEAPAPLNAVVQVEPVPVRIEIDTAQNVPADSRRLQTAVDSILRLAGPTAPGTGGLPVTKTGNVPVAADWQTWARLSSDPVAIRLPDPAAEETVSVYGVHSREGATVVLGNRTHQKTPTLLRITLPRGIYKIEKLSFDPPVEVAEDLSGRYPIRCAPVEGAVVRLDRLESGDLAATGRIEKPIWLKPEQVCLIRFTDVAFASRAAFYETRDKARAIRASAPTLANRLGAIFNAGDSYVSGLNGGTSGSLTKRLNCVHRLLLLTAQAHSMHHNSQERKSVAPEAGAALMEAIERLNDTLAETSAALLGLVPQISLETGETVAAPNRADSPAFPPAETGRPAEAGAKTSVVTLALTNTGSRSVELVKMGLDIAALPQEARCEPGDPAMFGTLHPGQTVRATFRLRLPADSVLTNRQCVGDVSYFVGSAPAHLRVHSW